MAAILALELVEACALPAGRLPMAGPKLTPQPPTQL